jgi:hypothetical protein
VTQAAIRPVPARQNDSIVTGKYTEAIATTRPENVQILACQKHPYVTGKYTEPIATSPSENTLNCMIPLSLANILRIIATTRSENVTILKCQNNPIVTGKYTETIAASWSENVQIRGFWDQC